MSVINKALRDLEARKRAEQQTEPTSPSSPDTESSARPIVLQSESSNSVPWFIMATLIAIAVGWCVGMFLYQSANALSLALEPEEDVIVQIEDHAELPIHRPSVEDEETDVQSIATAVNDLPAPAAGIKIELLETSLALDEFSAEWQEALHTAGTFEIPHESSGSFNFGVQLTAKALDEREVDIANRSIAAGDWLLAAGRLHQFISEQTEHQKSRAFLATEYLRRGQLDQAGQLLLAVHEGSTSALKMAKARWWMEHNQLEPALDLLSTSTPPINDNVEYYALVASLQQRTQRYDNAIQTYANLVEANPGKGDWWAGMAIGLDQIGLYQGAVDAYRKALAMPDLPEPLQNLALKRLSDLTETSVN